MFQGGPGNRNFPARVPRIFDGNFVFLRKRGQSNEVF
ncbi:hypothetical protein EBI_25806 [Enterocytozoon bieneusi H348]|nr:hypothetical protein EBI_25806 [Enterocytozoon bieneusi H348]|eukprot:XP_002651213.1 hypothetical protein EBI_25806 [Enterocytozoon bieneusi H348]